MADPAPAFDPFAEAGWTQPTAPAAPVTPTPATNDNASDNAAKPTLSDAEYDRITQMAEQPSDGKMSVSGATVYKAPATAPSSDAIPAGIPVVKVTPGPATPAPTAAVPQAFDPFAEAGWTPPAAAPTPVDTAPAPTVPAPAGPIASAEAAPVAAPTTQQEVRNQPWYQGIHDTLFSPVGTFAGATKEAQHAFTLGLDDILAPLIPAITKSLSSGTPFSQAYDQAVQEYRQPRNTFETENPATATAISLAAGAPTATLAAPLFGTAAPSAGIAARALTGARNIAAGATTGAVSGGMMTDGDLAQRAEGARQGAEMGGTLSAVAPAIGSAVRRLNTAFRPNAAVDPLAGQALRDAAGLSPTDAVPSPTPSPLPNTPIGVAGGFNSPGMAAIERRLNTVDDAGRLEEETAQNAGIRTAATGSVPGLPRLADAVAVPEAASDMTAAMQGAHGVLRDEERRLWTTPAMQAVTPDIPAAAARVQRTIGAMPQRYQDAMTRSPDVYNALQDFYNLPATASLHDMNAARSDILASARALPPTERFARLAANQAADAVLDAIESNPGLRTNPQALTDYRAARTYSRRLNSAFEQPQFQAMVNALPGNRKGLDPAVVGRGVFSLGRSSERTPGGVNNILGMLDDLRRTWGSLATANAGVPLPGLHPAAAFGARAELAQGYRNLIVNSMLDAAASTERDLSNNPKLIMNRLSQTIDDNRPWIQASGALNPSQMQVLDRIRDTAVMAAKLQSLRGGKGSETYERLTGGRNLDVFLGPLLTRTGGMAVGAGLGALAAHLFGEAGIGGEIGLELLGAGGGAAGAPELMRRLYAVPAQRLKDRLAEAIRDPAIAADLMRRAGETVSPATKQWLRALLAEAPTAEAARALGPESAGGQQ